MSGTNKVIVIGNLGGDPETHHTDSGTMICRFNLATTEKWKDPDGNRQEHTEWHRIKVFGRLAEIASKYLAKGSKIAVWGKLRTRRFQDRDGNDRSVTEIHMEEMEMLGNRQNGGNNAPRQQQSPSQQQPRQQQPRPPQQQPPQQPAMAGDNAGEFFDDDIPF